MMARIKNPNVTSYNAMRRQAAEINAFLDNPGHPLTAALRQAYERRLTRLLKKIVAWEQAA